VQESSAALHRSCLEQLETIKTQYYTFLSMFHPSDAAAAASMASEASLSGSGGYTSARSPTASSSSALGMHLQSSLNEDISSLKRRLERLSEGSLRPFAPESYSSLTRSGAGGSAGASSSSSGYMATPRS
jgi:hypothetical protein